jgi:hypothetical protein
VKLNYSTLRALALGCTALIPIHAASAADFNVSNGTTATSTQTVSNGGTGTVEIGGNINVDDVLEFGINAEDSLVTVNLLAAGSITTGSAIDSTLGTGSHGIYAASNTKIDNGGNITTYGSGAYGIYLSGTSNVLTHWGSITTAGAYGIGIYATDATTVAEQVEIVVAGTASIESGGERAHGIYLGDYGALTLQSDGTVAAVASFGGELRF